MRLADCFIDVLAYAKLFLRKPADSYEEFRARAEKLLRDSADAAQRAGFTPDDHRAAFFPVVAFIDEAVMTSSWSEAERWKRDLLQKTHFGTTKAGVEFFERLDRLSAQARPVREVFYFCMMLGFKGQFAFRQDQAGLETLKSQTLALLVEGSEGAGLEPDARLFPGAYPVDAGRARPGPPRMSRTTLALILVPPIALVVLYLVYQFLLGHFADSTLLFLK